MTIFASGGLKNGVDITKSIALGATLGGMAGGFLQASTESTEKVVEAIELARKQIKIAFFAARIVNAEDTRGYEVLRKNERD